MSRYDEALGEQDAERAADALWDTVSALPEFGAAWHNLAEVMGRLGRAQDARWALAVTIGLYRWQTQQDPEDPYHWYWLTCALTTAGDLAGAMDALAETLALEPSYADEALAEPELDALRGAPGFQALLKLATRRAPAL
jgi:predicted Zn-dependent protease